jgi:hypothetical protein
MAAEALGEMGALEIATKGGAYFLGAEEELGSLEEGKIGDVVVLHSNPLDDIRNTLDIQYVVQWGRVYEGDSLEGNRLLRSTEPVVVLALGGRFARADRFRRGRKCSTKNTSVPAPNGSVPTADARSNGGISCGTDYIKLKALTS